MKQFFELIHEYFFYIWLLMAATILSVLSITGSKAMQLFEGIDWSKLVYSEENASGYSTKSFRTKWGGSSRVLHVMITDKELIIKTWLLIAYIAKKHDLLHRIPLEKIVRTEIHEARRFTRLFIQFKGEQDELKEIVILSKNNYQIQEILNRTIVRS